MKNEVSLINFFIFFVYIQLWLTITHSLRTCTVITPEFIHSARKFSISLAVNNVNTLSQFDVTIENINFKDSHTIELQPNGIQIVEFNLPVLPRDEYVLRVNGQNGIHVHTSTLLKYAAYKPIFVIQTDKYLYRREETLHYRIICMNENLVPIIPDGSIEIKIMTQDYKTVYRKKSLRLEHFVISGELYLNSFELYSKTLQYYVARLSVAMNNEVLAAVTFQIENDKIDLRNEDQYVNVKCKPQKNTQNIVSNMTSIKNISSASSFTVQLENENQQRILKQNKVANFKIISSKYFEFFVYTVIGGGKIVISERIQLLEKEKEYNFQLNPTNQMAPISKLLVYTIDENNEFHWDEIIFYVERILENKITLYTPVSIVPNRKFELNIITAPNSYVGVLAIEETDNDKDCHPQHNDIKIDDLLQNFVGYSLQRGEITGTSILTSAIKRHNNERYFKKVRTNEERDPFETGTKTWRKTWLFAEISNTTSHSLVLRHNLPNEDTKWRITAFALHPELGLGFSQLQPSLHTLKTYNITFDLPEYIYEHEIINIPIRIENFLNEEINLRIEFIQENYDIELIPMFMNSTENIIISQKSSKVLRYTMRSSGTGMKSLKFLFFSTAGDYRQVEYLIVKPQGLAIIENQCLFIDLKNSTSFSKTIFPNDLYNQDTMTKYPLVNTYANLIEPVLEFLSKKTEDQTAEQASSTMAMNCLGLNYLKSSNKDETALGIQLLRNMHMAYLSILDYRDNETGSFQHFLSIKKSTGSIWLTAYVTSWLGCSKHYIDIEDTIIETALVYLAKTQNTNGSFQEIGIYSNSNTENNTLAMTAQVLLAFLENEKYYASYKPVLEKGIKYIVENLFKTESIYANTLSIYTLYKAGFQDLNKELSKLEEVSQTKDDYKFWTQENDFEINNAATTALILLTALGINENLQPNYIPAIKWLIEQGGIYNFNNRGLYPSYATVLGFKFLINFMHRTDVLTKADVTIGYRGLFGMEYEEFELNDKISEKQSLKLDNYMGGLEIDAIGQGYLLAVISFNYNSLKQNNRHQFEISIHRPSPGYMVSFVMRICIKYVGTKKYADLTILEANMPSGYSIKWEQLQQIIQNKFIVKQATMNAAGSEVKFYLKGLQRDKSECILMEPFRIHSIAKQVSVPIVCYEYTNLANMVVAYFDIKAKTYDS